MKNVESLEYFKTLDIGVLDDVRSRFREETYKAGENIFIEGDISKGIYFVASGTVKVYKSSRDGKEQILKLIYEGDSFNDVTVFSSDMSPASADAVTDVKLYLLSRDNTIDLIYKYPEISLNIIRSFTEKLRYLTSRIEDLSLRHTQERIANILLLFDGQRLSRKIIADIAGTAREVVSRTLKDFASKGIIKVEKRDIIILNREKLKDSAV
ncbi:Crp/Fnr family transcriptional regulator [Candidatus Acidulodesulfobacterium sp. H_13]|uniref:Crp/Fnr family transcriptional regulator n=1 Tax=Candidatus Acidulodesulfobacterium sp. H_13 TaxID=3395470 RepID=UPI003AF83FDF